MQPIDQLKKYVLKSKNLKEPLDYFFDLVEQDYFKDNFNCLSIDALERPEIGYFMDALEMGIEQKIGIRVEKIDPILAEIKGHHCIHGICFVNTTVIIPVTVVLFTDIQTGVAVLCTDQTHMLRFSFVVSSEMGNIQ